jgi:hypothetical protein
MGHHVVPCVHLSARGAGGEKRKPILHGIDLVSERIRHGQLKVVRNEGTRWLIREAGMYCYDPEKLSENPIDDNNHAMDALRYLVVGLDRGKQSQFESLVGPDPTPVDPRIEQQARQDAALADDDRWY